MFAVEIPIASSILLVRSWPRAWAVVVMDLVAELFSAADHDLFGRWLVAVIEQVLWWLWRRLWRLGGTQNVADRDSSFNSIMAEVISDFLLKPGIFKLTQESVHIHSLDVLILSHRGRMPAMITRYFSESHQTGRIYMGISICALTLCKKK